MSKKLRQMFQHASLSKKESSKHAQLRPHRNYVAVCTGSQLTFYNLENGKKTDIVNNFEKLYHGYRRIGSYIPSSTIFYFESDLVQEEEPRFVRILLHRIQIYGFDYPRDSVSGKIACCGKFGLGYDERREQLEFSFPKQAHILIPQKTESKLTNFSALLLCCVRQTPVLKIFNMVYESCEMTIQPLFSGNRYQRHTYGTSLLCLRNDMECLEIAVGSGDGELSIFRLTKICKLATGTTQTADFRRLVFSYDLHRGEVTDLCYDSGQSVLFSCSTDNTVRLLSLEREGEHMSVSLMHILVMGLARCGSKLLWVPAGRKVLLSDTSGFVHCFCCNGESYKTKRLRSKVHDTTTSNNTTGTDDNKKKKKKWKKKRSGRRKEEEEELDSGRMEGCLWKDFVMNPVQIEREVERKKGKKRSGKRNSKERKRINKMCVVSGNVIAIGFLDRVLVMDLDSRERRMDLIHSISLGGEIDDFCVCRAEGRGVGGRNKSLLDRVWVQDRKERAEYVIGELIDVKLEDVFVENEEEEDDFDYSDDEKLLAMIEERERRERSGGKNVEEKKKKKDETKKETKTEVEVLQIQFQNKNLKGLWKSLLV